MLITAVDHHGDLFAVKDVLSADIVNKVLTTDWLNLPWQRQEGQESWRRRRILNEYLPWLNQWNQFCQRIWPCISQAIGIDCGQYTDTAWWLDEPGFTCSLHTDGEMPGAMQLTWLGNRSLGTTFYNFKNSNSIRYGFELWPNQGYIMINMAKPNGYRHLQWHGMLTPVPAQSFRLTSYTWIYPKLI